MPSTHLTSHSDPSTTRERVRTGIIVSVVVGTFALLILAYVLVKRRMNRNVKAGVVVGKKSYLEDTSRGKDDAGYGGGRGVRCWDSERGVNDELAYMVDSEIGSGPL
jgi:hypothetical protein